MKQVRLVLVFIAAASVSDMSAQQSRGGYSGVVRTEWLPDGRKMKLLEDFTFVDPTGRQWKAKKNSVIDGASIPQAFWGTGGPYEGTYRDASVIHDVFCDETPKSRTWQSVHRMFFEALLVSGVAYPRALVMYGAVYEFGPKWPDPLLKPMTVCTTQNGTTTCSVLPSPSPPLPQRPPTESDVKMLEELVNSGRITTPEDIEAWAASR